MDDIPWLRHQPRQQRAVNTVEKLLDTAETVFRDIGYDKANTNLIAETSGIPVGTLYRWFPDKAALADGLAARYLAELADTYATLVTDRAPSAVLIRSAIEDLAALVRQHPAMPAIIAASATSDTGQRLRTTMTDGIGTIVRTLVPTAADHDVDRIAGMLTTIAFALLGDALRDADPDGYPAVVDEFCDLVTAWMSARFPPEDDPVWGVTDPLVTPLAPSPVRSLRQAGPDGLGGRGAPG